MIGYSAPHHHHLNCGCCATCKSSSATFSGGHAQVADTSQQGARSPSPSCFLSLLRYPRDISLLAWEGQSRRTAGTGSPGPLRPGRVTIAGRPHTGGPGDGRDLPASPRVTRSSRLLGPPHAACRLQTWATPGSYQPLVSRIGARREPAKAPAHSHPEEHARSQRPHGSESVRRGGRVMGGVTVEGRGGAGRAGTPRFGRRGASPGIREAWRPGLGQGQVESPLLFFPGTAAKAGAAA